MVKMELIDKKETIRLLAKSRDSEPVHGDVSFGIKAGVDKAMIVISNFADVVEERKHGHWVQVSDWDKNGQAHFDCSVCGAGDVHADDAEVPYCWHCGAVMDEVTKQ